VFFLFLIWNMNWLHCWFSYLVHVCMTKSSSLNRLCQQKKPLLVGSRCWLNICYMYAKVLVLNHLGQRKFHFLMGFKLLVSISLTCMSMSSLLNHLGHHKNHFLVDFRLLDPISVTCMSMSSLLNHLSQHKNHFLVGFWLLGSISTTCMSMSSSLNNFFVGFNPCWFPSLRPVYMSMSSSLNHIAQRKKSLLGGF